MADVTESSEPTAGGQLSGETSRAAAVKRYQKQAGELGNLKPQAPQTSAELPKRKKGV